MAENGGDGESTDLDAALRRYSACRVRAMMLAYHDH